MKTTPSTPTSLTLLLTCVCAAGMFSPVPARAQAVHSGTSTTIGGRRITTPEAVSPATTGTSGISPRASSAITAGFKYEPPPPPKPEDDEVDLRDIDKPRNQIIRLPKYVVTVRRPPVFSDRGLYAQDQLRRLAIARYLSDLDKGLLNRWTFADIGLAIGTSNADRAMQIYLDNERLQNMGAVQQQISNQQAAGNTDSAQQIKSQYYDMFLRPQDKVNARPDSMLGQLGK